MKSIVELLKQSHLGAGVSDAMLERIAGLGREESYGSGECVSRLGSPDSDLLLVREGRLKMTTSDEDKLREIAPGGVAGEIAFVEASARHCDLVAVGRTTVVRFGARELRGLLAANRHDGFMYLANLCRVMAARMRHSDGRLDALMDLEAVDAWEHAL